MRGVLAGRAEVNMTPSSALVSEGAVVLERQPIHRVLVA